MLSHYNYRLNARHFVQELFQDVNFDKVMRLFTDSLPVIRFSCAKKSPTHKYLSFISRLVIVFWLVTERRLVHLYIRLNTLNFFLL